MKKLILVVVVVVIALLIGNAMRGPSDEECQSAWGQMDAGANANANATDYDTYQEYLDAFEAEVGMVISLILNTNHTPDSVGGVLKTCIEMGWTGWR